MNHRRIERVLEESDTERWGSPGLQTTCETKTTPYETTTPLCVTATTLCDTVTYRRRRQLLKGGLIAVISLGILFTLARQRGALQSELQAEATETQATESEMESLNQAMISDPDSAQVQKAAPTALDDLMAEIERERDEKRERNAQIEQDRRSKKDATRRQTLEKKEKKETATSRSNGRVAEWFGIEIEAYVQGHQPAQHLLVKQMHKLVPTWKVETMEDSLRGGYFSPEGFAKGNEGHSSLSPQQTQDLSAEFKNFFGALLGMNMAASVVPVIETLAPDTEKVVADEARRLLRLESNRDMSDVFSSGFCGCVNPSIADPWSGKSREEKTYASFCGTTWLPFKSHCFAGLEIISSPMPYGRESSQLLTTVLGELSKEFRMLVDVSTGFHVHVDVSSMPKQAWQGLVHKRLKDVAEHNRRRRARAMRYDRLPDHINPVTITKLLQLYTERRPARLRDDRGVLMIHDLAAACVRWGTKGQAMPLQGRDLCRAADSAAREVLQSCSIATSSVKSDKPGKVRKRTPAEPSAADKTPEELEVSRMLESSRLWLHDQQASEVQARCVIEAEATKALRSRIEQAHAASKFRLFRVYPASWLVGSFWNSTTPRQVLEAALKLSSEGFSPLDQAGIVPHTIGEDREFAYARPVDGLLAHIRASAEQDPSVWSSRRAFFGLLSRYPSRGNSSDTLASTDTKDGWQALSAYIQGLGTWSEFFCRYSVNLCALAEKGTIEYREHPGTLHGKEIEAWVDHVVGLTTDAFAKPWSLRTAAGVVQFQG